MLFVTGWGHVYNSTQVRWWDVSCGFIWLAALSTVAGETAQCQLCIHVLLPVLVFIQLGQKNVAFYFCPYLHQLLNNFQHSFTGTLCGQFAITWLLHIQLHCKCISALPCEISMKYAHITRRANKHFGKIVKKHFRPTLQWVVCVTLNCVGLTQS